MFQRPHSFIMFVLTLKMRYRVARGHVCLSLQKRNEVNNKQLEGPTHTCLLAILGLAKRPHSKPPALHFLPPPTADSIRSLKYIKRRERLFGLRRPRLYLQIHMFFSFFQSNTKKISTY